jgi:carboxypeptidase family protein
VAPDGKSNPGTNYPLWIIAISLLAIAICVVIDSIGRQKVKRDSGISPTATISIDESAANAKPAAVRVAANSRRKLPAEAPPAENSPTNAAADSVAGPEVAVIPASQSTVGGPQPVGYSVSGISQGANPMGEIAGRIILNGTPPPERILNADPICSKPIMTHTFAVGESNGLADAVVFLKQGIDRTAFPVSTNVVTILFTNCDVQPYLTALVSRQTVNFRDGEGAEHYLSLSDSGITRTLIVPKKIVPMKSEVQFRFTRPRLFVPVVCLKHPWEKAFICVLENPFFAVTDKNGNFDIPNVPPGTYTIEVAHPGATGTNGVTRSVMVVAGKRAELNLALSVRNDGGSPSVQAENSVPRN